MPMCHYPDDREVNPIQLTLSEFVQEGSGYYTQMEDGTREEELKFLKFVLAGRQGLDLRDQRSITLNVTQGQDDIGHITATRDYDSLIGTTKTLPYIVPLSIWPVASFRDTLKVNNHITSIAFDNQDNPLYVPMHSIPNLAVGKVSNRSAIRVFFPRMYRAFDSKKITGPDLELIYNRCLLPIVQRLMRNQATHWPPNYEVALETSRDRAGRLHLGTLDIPAHLLSEFARSYLERIQTLRPYFRDAYFGHELRGWKAATVHNLERQDNQDNEGGQDAYERVNALQDLTRVLDMDSINREQWLVDVGVEFGNSGKVVTWRSLGHEALIHFLLPELENPGRVLGRSKRYYIDNQMHLKDLAGFRWTPGSHSEDLHYIQAYTTEKAVSYQLHHGIFSHRKPSELVNERLRGKLINDLDEQGQILYTCTGDGENGNNIAQEGCARLEVRVSLAGVDNVLTRFPRDLLNRTMVQIPARYWWYFKWLRLAAVFKVIQNIQNTPAKDRSSENCLALGAIVIWILNGAHRTPGYRMIGLAKEACAEVMLNEDDDPEDVDAITTPLMYEAGVYFMCDVVMDERTYAYRIPFGKTFTPQLITQAYEFGTMNELRHMLGVGEVQTGRRKPHSERTSNRTSNQTLDVRHIRAPNRPLPALGPRLDGLPLPNPPRPVGPDVNYFQRHGGGNREVIDFDEEPDIQENAQNPLKNRVQVILEQMFYDILHESPNKKNHQEGAWTNIPQAFRQQLAIEDLYLRLEFPFEAVQYTVCSEEQWKQHFNRFFPPKVPEYAGQNFGKARYFHSYINLIRELRPQRVAWVRAELERKFRSLAWIPYTESDRMWSTKKMHSSRWINLPKGSTKGPKIAVNPRVMTQLHQQPRLRAPPRVEDFREEEEEQEEREEQEEQEEQE